MFAETAKDVLEPIIGADHWRILAQDYHAEQYLSFFPALKLMEERLITDLHLAERLRRLDRSGTGHGVETLLRELELTVLAERQLDLAEMSSAASCNEFDPFKASGVWQNPDKAAIMAKLAPYKSGSLFGRDQVLYYFGGEGLSLSLFVSCQPDHRIRMAFIEDGPGNGLFWRPSTAKQSDMLLAWISKQNGNVVDLIQAATQVANYFEELGDRSSHFHFANSNLDAVSRRDRDCAILSLRFRVFQLPEIDLFRAGLRAMPYVETNGFLAGASFSPHHATQLKKVQVADIIGGPGAMHNWDLTDRGGKNYVYDLAHSIQQGKIIPDNPPSLSDNSDRIVLAERDGKYVVTSNGRHRCAALKGLGNEQIAIWAFVEVYQA